jgi:hypothetical protein
VYHDPPEAPGRISDWISEMEERHHECLAMRDYWAVWRAARYEYQLIFKDALDFQDSCLSDKIFWEVYLWILGRRTNKKCSAKW